MKIEITKHHKAFFIIPTLWVSYDDETIISITWFAYSIDFVI